MIHLGLDLGSKTLGIAKSDASGIIASTYTTLRFNDDDYAGCLEELLLIIDKEKVSKIILGYPKHMNGDIGDRAKISEMFKDMILDKTSNVEVILWDERLTSREVDRIMVSGNTRRDKRKQKKDELAAQIILQGYLDSY